MAVKRKVFYVFVSILVLLIVARLALPWAVEYIAEKKLNESPGLSGSLEDVDLHLYRGAYEIEGLRISVVQNDEHIPVLTVSKIDFSVLWSALFAGKVVAEIFVKEPHIFFVDKVEKEEPGKYDALSSEKSWVKLLDTAFPLKIDRLEVTNGKLEFTGQKRNKKAAFLIDSINGKVTDISSVAPSNGVLPASLEVKGKLYGTAEFSVNGSANLHSQLPDFDFDASAEKLSMNHFDDLIKMYAPFDLEAGALDFAMEMRAKEGKINGYVEAGVHDPDVFSWKDDFVKDDDNPFELLVEAIVGGITSLLENEKTDRVATKVPVEGDLTEPDTPFFPAVVGLFRNAFVEAYDMEVDDIISYRQSSE